MNDVIIKVDRTLPLSEQIEFALKEKRTHENGFARITLDLLESWKQEAASLEVGCQP